MPKIYIFLPKQLKNSFLDIFSGPKVLASYQHDISSKIEEKSSNSDTNKPILSSVFKQKYTNILSRGRLAKCQQHKNAEKSPITIVERMDIVAADQSDQYHIDDSSSIDCIDRLSTKSIDNPNQHDDVKKLLIFFIHGVGGCMQIWEQQIQYFSSRGKNY